MSLKRRIFTKEFKQQTLREAQAGKPIALAARKHDRPPNLVGKWQKLHEQYAQGAERERLIGQQTVESSLLPH